MVEAYASARGATMKATSATVAALLVLFDVPAAVAHHGVAPHYDNDRIVTLDGVVTKFDFINPHAFVYVAVTADTGEEQVWQCELASRSVLSRNGLTAGTFEPGATGLQGTR